MLDLTVPQLAALDNRSYTGEVKARLRDDQTWVVLLNPALIERTRFTLRHIVDSIDAQKARVTAEGTPDPRWLKSVNMLRHYAKVRLDLIPPSDLPVLSGSKEARAWRSFSARLAAELGAAVPEALDTLRTPYGGLTAREWLAVREEKREAI